MRNTSWISRAEHAVPYAPVLSGGRFSRHFVPGYDLAVPPGQKPFAPYEDTLFPT
jgi:hypothetical protein